MRSYHFVPAHNRRFLERIPDLAADRFVLELEDGVGDNEKEEARRNSELFLSQVKARDYFLRVNPLDSEHWKEDLKMLLRLKELPSIVLPKVETVQEVRDAATLLHGAKEVRFLTLIESFSGLASCRELARIPEVMGLGIGMEDLMSETVHAQIDLESLVSGVQLEVVLAARAAGKVAIDTISTTIRDENQFREECKRSRSRGFHGRFLIHPMQISIANEVYAPSSEMEEWAREILHLSGGDETGGYQSLRGRVVSGPMVLKAKSITNQLENIK